MQITYTRRHAAMSCLAAASALLATSAGAEVIDDFNDGILDPAWAITFPGNGAGWTFEETGGQLVVTDVVDENLDTRSGQTDWGRVRLTQSIGPFTGDFVAETAFTWDSEDANQAMQQIWLRLAESDGTRVVDVVYNDSQVSFSGSRISRIGTGGSTSGVNTEHGDQPFAGTDVWRIERTNNAYSIYVNDILFHSTTPDQLPLQTVEQVSLEFTYYGFTGSGGSFFGTESVDYVTIIPEPTTLALLFPAGLLIARRRRG